MFRYLKILLIFLLAPAAQADLLDLSQHSAFHKVYFIPAKTAQDVEVRVFLPVGEADRSGPEGLAHYLEHLVAWSADQVHGPGLRHREMNAWASPFWTAYWNRGARDAFDDMIRHAGAVFAPLALDRPFMRSERDVVEREFDLRYRDNGPALLYTAALHHLYGAHGLGRSTMGTPQSLARITPEMAERFRRQHYSAASAYLVILGPLEKGEVIAALRAHLAELPVHAPPPRGFAAPLPAPPEAGLEIELPMLERPRLLWVGQAAAPSGMSRRRLWFSMLLLSDILNGSAPEGLRKPLYYDSFTVTFVDSYLELLPGGALRFAIALSPEDDVPAAQALDALRAALRDLARRGISQGTLEALRGRTRQAIRRLEREKVSYHLEIAQKSLLNLGSALDVKAYHYEIGQPGTADLNALLRAIVQSDFTTSAIARPESP